MCHINMLWLYTSLVGIEGESVLPYLLSWLDKNSAKNAVSGPGVYWWVWPWIWHLLEQSRKQNIACIICMEFYVHIHNGHNLCSITLCLKVPENVWQTGLFSQTCSVKGRFDLLPVSFLPHLTAPRVSCAPPGEVSDSDSNSSSSSSDSDSSSEDEEFRDGYGDDLMGDEEDRARLEQMTEKEREQELFNRIEKREVLKRRWGWLQRPKYSIEFRPVGACSGHGQQGGTHGLAVGMAFKRSLQWPGFLQGDLQTVMKFCLSGLKSSRNWRRPRRKKKKRKRKNRRKSRRRRNRTGLSLRTLRWWVAPLLAPLRAPPSRPPSPSNP